MSNEEDECKTNQVNCTNSQAEDLDSDVVANFKIIIFVVLFVLLVFLGFFVYNLIKCYLPKWTGKKRLQEDVRPAEIVSSHEVKAGEGVEIEL